MLPVRCYTCGKVLGNLQTEWDRHREVQPEKWSGFFEKFNIRRYCCKRVIMTQTPDLNQQRQMELPASVEKKEESSTITRFYLAR